MFAQARDAGLGTTIHTGETAYTGPIGMNAVIEHFKPDRIGHGIHAAKSEKTMEMLAEQGIVLEVCPTSNLHTKAISQLSDLKEIFERFDEFGVRYTINTDGTYFCKTNLRREFRIISEANILSPERLEEVRLEAFAASFL